MEKMEKDPEKVMEKQISKTERELEKERECKMSRIKCNSKNKC